jgi:hypothetical protein
MTIGPPATDLQNLSRHQNGHPSERARAETISLVITCYNHARFLAEAIESALAQQTPFDEILLVDDGSTDDTAAVAARYPGVEYVHQHNQGLSSARNAGLRRAVCHNIVFLDADDRLLPGATRAGLDCFARHPDAAFVFGRYEHLRRTGVSAPARVVHGHGHDAYDDLLRFNFIAAHDTVMYRREAVLAVGGFDAVLRAAEDYDLYLRLARRYPLASHETLVAQYRQHDGNMSLDARLMLRSTLLVLKRQRSLVAGDPARLASYREGVRNWQRHFGTKLGAQIVKGARPGVSRWRLLSDAVVVAVYAPQALRKHRAVALQAIVSSLVSRLPKSWRSRLAGALGVNYLPPVGRIDLGDLKRREPFCRDFGYSRGTPVDRYYIQNFLAAHADRIAGRVLEVGDDGYTRGIGGSRVTQSDVLNVDSSIYGTSIAGDLSLAATVPAGAFDCIIATQTLHLIWDIHGAVKTLHGMLAPGGTLLLTVPGTISQLEQGRWKETWYWGFGPIAIERLFAGVFPAEDLEIAVHGNALSSVAFIEGIAAEELARADLDHRDELYPLLITVRARRRAASPTTG